MASTLELASAGAVVLIILAGMWYGHSSVLRARASPTRGPTSMVGLYAAHRGSVVGEVVAVTDEFVVLRQSGVAKAIPRAQARIVGNDVQIEGDVDWAKAEESGRAFQA